MHTNFRKPCNDCPFRRKSPGGWLGPWKPMELLQSLAYQAFPCHQTIPTTDDLEVKDDPWDIKAEDDDLWEPKPEPAHDRPMEGCAGAAIFLNNKIELSRCPDTLLHQQKLKEIPQAEKDVVFKWPQEFVEHHTMKPKRKRAAK